LLAEDLFSIIPGRQHHAFPEYVYSPDIRNPQRFGPKMKELSTRLDKRHTVIVDE
jgi:hypothetical protein